ncbi:MAG: hypothetical protein WCH98_23265, partial [Verrucomicrobiota bacterium]
RRARGLAQPPFAPGAAPRTKSFRVNPPGRIVRARARPVLRRATAKNAAKKKATGRGRWLGELL